ncbi:YdjY domain-containing protein [bacterium]|nr:YdjY domain-containing protein [bacterium]
MFVQPTIAFSQEKSEPIPLNKKETVLLDKENNRLLLKGEICLRQGVLEMFLCGKQTKEHESIVSLDAKASVVHAGLLALGAKPGEPVQFQPNYKAPQGQEIHIFVSWLDSERKIRRRPVQNWVRHVTFRYFEEPLVKVPAGVKINNRDDDGLRYDEMNRLLLFYGTMSKDRRDEFLAMSDEEEFQKAIKKMYKESQPHQMSADFVFAGSGFSKLDDGTNYYQAEGGSFICVANFADAMIDVAINSSASDSAGRSFEPWTERIPKEGTPVTVELIPVKKAKADKPIKESKE